MRTFLYIILVVVIAAGLWFTWAALLPVNPGEAKFVLLRPGWSARHIASTLQREGVIRSATAFMVVHYAMGKGNLKAGEYKFDVPANALQVRDRVQRGDVYARNVVVPEGYNIYDIAAVVEQAGLGPAADFIGRG